MAEIEITLPTVQYGNVKVKATPEELGVDVASPAAVGTATAVYLNLFTQGFALGASMDVTASNLKPRTVDEANDVAKAVIEKELGSTTDVTDAPWDQPVDSKPKPWETEVTAPAVLDATW